MLRMLSDEDVPGDIIRGSRQRQPSLDIVRAQEVGLMHTPDPDILEWAAREGRQLITRDRTTMTPHAYERVAHGLPMPGVFVIPEEMSVGPAVKELELIALASESDDWRDRVIFLPLQTYGILSNAFNNPSISRAEL
jgi:hypothetical protein